MGWSGTKNGKCLAFAPAEFDVTITVDKNMKYQKYLKIIPIAVVVLDSVFNERALGLINWLGTTLRFMSEPIRKSTLR
jgi:hypothetical protein